MAYHKRAVVAFTFPATYFGKASCCAVVLTETLATHIDMPLMRHKLNSLVNRLLLVCSARVQWMLGLTQ